MDVLNELHRLEVSINGAHLFESAGSLPTFEAVSDKSRDHAWHRNPSAEQKGGILWAQKMTPFACQPDSPIRKKESVKPQLNFLQMTSPEDPYPLDANDAPRLHLTSACSLTVHQRQAQNMGGYEGLKPNSVCNIPRTESGGGHFDLTYKNFHRMAPAPQRQQAVAK